MFDDKMFLLLIMPVIFIQVTLSLYVVVQVLNKGVRSLTKPLWLIIGLMGGIVGSILFIIYGKVSESNVEDQ